MKFTALTLAVIALAIPDVASAGSFTFYGPIYSRYKMSLEDGGGCISGSIGDAIPANRQGTIYFVSEENAGSVRKSAYFGFADGSIKDEFLPGLSTFTMCLKPGRYRIFGVSTYDLVSKERINLPFEVVAGKNFYIGSFVFYGYAPEPECEATTARVYVGYRDEFIRDEPHLKGRKDSPKIPLERMPLKVASGFPYLVACKVQ